MGILTAETPSVPRGPLVVYVRDLTHGPGPWLMGAAVLCLVSFRVVTGSDIEPGWTPEALAALLVLGGGALWFWWRRRPRPNAVFDPTTRIATFFDGDGDSRVAFDEIEAVEIPKVLVDPGESRHEGSASWSDDEPYLDFGQSVYAKLRGGGAKLVRQSKDHSDLVRTRALLESFLGLPG
jgi:hypothetical protein